jgi:CheY-like chemotaxis protein
MLRRRLAKHGYEMIVAEDGERGVKAALREKPDLILMDLSLPVLTGWEAAQQLKQSAQTQTIPIIALSAHALEGERDKALAAGCDEFKSNRSISKRKRLHDQESPHGKLPLRPFCTVRTLRPSRWPSSASVCRNVSRAGPEQLVGQSTPICAAPDDKGVQNSRNGFGGNPPIRAQPCACLQRISSWKRQYTARSVRSRRSIGQDVAPSNWREPRGPHPTPHFAPS